MLEPEKQVEKQIFMKKKLNIMSEFQINFLQIVRFWI